MYKLWEHQKLTLENIEQIKYTKQYGIYPKSMIPNEDGFNFIAIFESGDGRNDAKECRVKDGGQGCFLPGVDYSKIIGWARV